MSEPLSRREREKKSRLDGIVETAEEMFAQRGYENTSMDDIARASEFTKRTLYKYFMNKEDLFFAVIRGCFQKLFAYVESSFRSGKTGQEKMKAGLAAYFRFYRENPEKFRLMNYIGFAKSDDADVPNYKSFLSLDSDIFRGVMRVIDEGKADGSIRKDLDTAYLAYSMIFLVTGFLNELSIAGKTFTRHFSLDQEKFSRFVMDLLAGVFLPPGKSEAASRRAG